MFKDPVLLLGLLAFAALLLALPLAFWSLSGSDAKAGGKVAPAGQLVRGLVVAANLLLTSQLLWRWLDSGHFP
ncbi:MAG: cytochrome c biogenesis protein CcsA, partial [Synechococcaceae bacterium WB6_3B_236]|nr:cytochrome c biogenesis protein CcsA [Synechococcaceae bacterium WB6_3B_236]